MNKFIKHTVIALSITFAINANAKVDVPEIATVAASYALTSMACGYQSDPDKQLYDITGSIVSKYGDVDEAIRRHKKVLGMLQASSESERNVACDFMYNEFHRSFNVLGMAHEQGYF